MAAGGGKRLHVDLPVNDGLGLLEGRGILNRFFLDLIRLERPFCTALTTSLILAPISPWFNFDAFRREFDDLAHVSGILLPGHPHRALHLKLIGKRGQEALGPVWMGLNNG